MRRTRTAIRFGLVHVLAAAMMLCCGCDLFVFTPKQRVKRHITEFAAAITANDLHKAAGFCDPKMYWEVPSGVKKRGQAAIMGFLDSFLQMDRKVDKLGGVYVYVKKIDLKDPTKAVAEVKFEAHLVLNAATLSFARINWATRMFWVKEGMKTWKCVGIKELTTREMGGHN